MSIGDTLLVAPEPGHTVTIGVFTVECRKCRCCTDRPPMFIVRTAAGAVVAMGRSFRRLAHFRRWQLDPEAKHEHDWSWPDDELNAWQRLCWYLARNDLDLGDTAGPITRVHPDCVVQRDIKPAKAPEPTAEAPPPPAKKAVELPGPPIQRGEADGDGQMGLWG